MAKILIAEDESDIRDLIKFTLNFAGHEVVATSNGEEAYLKSLEMTPDLIMMDVRMPRMTGYEACRRMKAIDRLKPIPVVFLSAKGQESEVKAGLEAGAVEYILKPFAPTQLTERVNKLLEKYGTQSQQSPAAAPPLQTPPAQQSPAAAPPLQTPPAQPSPATWQPPQPPPTAQPPQTPPQSQPPTDGQPPRPPQPNRKENPFS